MALSPDVSRKEPDFIARFQDRRGASVFISLLGVRSVSPSNLSLDMLLQLVEFVNE